MPVDRSSRVGGARLVLAVVVFAAAAGAVAGGTESASDAARRKVLDQILDVYVRDGFVYYYALKVERARLDAFVGQLADADLAAMSRDERLAFWLNAYNALVLRTVVDHYPIQGSAPGYPSRSIRQIPGAFEQTVHQVAGRSVTLDLIEQTILPEFGDPRVFFALGRGAVGGGRLRSEAFQPDAVESQLASVAAECASRPGCVRVERDRDVVQASPIFSWRERDFVAAYAEKAPAVVANRSPVERAIIAFVYPQLLPAERAVVAGNTFATEFGPFDWSLNDLAGRGR